MIMLTEALEIQKGGIITCVGAGGKSSLLMSLAGEWRENKGSFLLTTTTKMFFPQVINFAPVFSRDQLRGKKWVSKFLGKFGYAGWFTGWRGIKVDGIPPGWIDEFSGDRLVSAVFVEGDGARQKLLKVPAEYEPVIPKSTDLVVGVLSLQALGQELDSRVVHRLERMEAILGKKQGHKLVLPDLAALALHPQGIYGGFPGKKILVLTGAHGTGGDDLREILNSLKKMALSHVLSSVIITEGFGSKMRVKEVARL